MKFGGAIIVPGDGPNQRDLHVTMEEDTLTLHAYIQGRLVWGTTMPAERLLSALHGLVDD